MTSTLVRPPRARPITLSGVIAAAGAAAVGFDRDLLFGVTLGTAFALALIPLWIATAARRRIYLALCGIVIACVLFGVVLGMTNAVTHTSISAGVLQRSALVLNLAVGVGLLLWAHRVIGVASTCIAFGVGATFAIPFAMAGGITWRFTFSIPVTLLVLALVSAQRRVWLSIGALVVLAGVGLLNDSRSNSSFLLLAAALLLWQRLLAASSTRNRGVGLVVVVAGVATATYLLLQSAIVEGAFGEATQQRTVAQLQATGGNLFLGARPEAAAAAALIARHPWGLGSGARTSYDDVAAAKTAMSAIGYDPDNGYVERYMFGSAVEVHSVIGDLWLWFGIAGVALAVYLVVTVLRGTLVAYRHGAITALFAWVAFRALWDTAFSPFGSAAHTTTLVLSLAIAHICYRYRPHGPSLTSLDAGR